MAFTRVKPGNWAANEELTSAQMNSLDTDHANALDKTSAGDTLSGNISVTGSGKVVANIHDAIISNTDSGISVGVANGISINHATGLTLEGSHWPAFRSSRTRTIVVAPTVTSLSTSGGWSTDGFAAIGPGNAIVSVVFDIATLHDGATLSSVDCIFAVGLSHSGVPVNKPTFNVLRTQDQTVVGVATTSAISLSSGAGVPFPAPGTGAAYYASGNRQKWTFTCDQNNVIDRSKYRYVINLTDEGGSNALSGNTYFAFVLNFTAISNMRFQ